MTVLAGFDFRRAAVAALVVWCGYLWYPVFAGLWSVVWNSRWIDESGALIVFDMLLHTVSLALVAIVIFRPVLTRLHLLLAVTAAGLSVHAGDLFVVYVHPFFMEHALYPDWLGRGAAAGQSAQYAKTFLGMVLLSALTSMLFIKRLRSFDRIYVWLIASSVLVTTVLFHFTIRESIFESRMHQKRVMALAIESPNDWIYKALCKRENFECYESKVGLNYPVTGDELIDKQIPHHIETTKGHPGYTWSVSGSFPLPGLDKPSDHHLMFHWVNEDTYRVLVERAQWHRTLQKFQLIYSWIGIPAHLLWLAGGLWLMYWHKARWRKRQKTVVS